MALSPKFLGLALSLALAAPAGAAPPTVQPAPAAASEELRQALRQLVEPALADGEAVPPEIDGVRRFYASRGFAPAWVTQPERAESLAAGVALAAEQALDCGSPGPLAMVAAAGRGAALEARQDIELTRLALRCAAALAQGRVRFQDIETDWIIAPPRVDVAAGLEKALRRGDIAGWLASLAPQHAGYVRLREAYAHYRALAAKGPFPTVKRGPSLKPGMTDERVEEVRHRLVAEGILAEDAASGTEFDPVLEDAVRRFQARHGITVDGAVGPRTLAALNVGVRARVEQIALNLERWRALPRDFGRDYIFVNVPAATLDLVEEGATVASMKVVVGDKDHPTPVLQTTTAAVVINPFWTVPNSIYVNEIQPKLKQDRHYLTKNEMVFTPGRGLQQLPGAKNPLGRIKFETPNRFDVYLHDTPSRLAFDRAARAQSHGCVRVEKARDLAALALQPLGWTPADIDQAIDKGETQRIELKKRWRVHILYATAFVDADEVVNFRDDLYGRDLRLRTALAAAAPISSAEAAVKKARVATAAR